MSYAEYKDKGLTGLANLGNSCFMNSALQCLSHTYELNDFLGRGAYKRKLNKKAESLILMEWDKLREMIWSENCIISPGGFLSSVQKVAKIKDKDMFTGFAQNDLSEFLTFLIDCFHTAILRDVDMRITGTVVTEKDELAKNCFDMMKGMYKKEYSEFLNMFYGIHVSKVETLGGSYLNAHPEPFLMLDLAIPKKRRPSIIDCLDAYTEKETLDGDNEVFNEKTGKKEAATRQIVFWSLPNVLIITLKRFSNDVRKNQTLVDFPLEDLDLSRYVVGYDSLTYVYDLYGVCNHSGCVQGGHYTAHALNANKRWYHFNDTAIHQVTNVTSIVSPKAYCFFYRKKNPTL